MRRLSFILIIIGGLLPQRTASACASCACGDPTLTTIGLEKPFAGRLRLSSSVQLRGEEQGGTAALPALRSDEVQIDTGVSFALTRWLVLGARVPFVHRQLSYASGRQQRAMGLGDVDLTARIVVFKDSPTLANHILSIQPGFVFPTSPDVILPTGERAGYDLQTGRGSWVPVGGINYSYFGPRTSFFGSLSVHVPIGARFGEQRGLTTLATTLVQVQPFDVLALQLGFDGRYSLPNTEGGLDVPDTGGWAVFLSPGVAVSPVLDLLLSVVVRVPILQRSFGDHREGPVFFVAAAYDLAT